MVEWFVIIAGSILVSVLFFLLIFRLRGQDPELSNFLNEVQQELQNVDLSNPNAIKEFMNRKIDEIDKDYKNAYSDVIDEAGLEFGERKTDESNND